MKIYFCSDSLTGIFNVVNYCSVSNRSFCSYKRNYFADCLLVIACHQMWCLPLLHRAKQGMIVIHLCLLQLFFSCTKHIALTLWDQLGDGTPQHHQKSVELFYQLHNLVPSSSICEDVISQQLTHRDKASCSCIYLKMSKVCNCRNIFTKRTCSLRGEYE